MTLKRYKAKSIVSIGLYGKGAIDFMPDSKGGSYYSTTDKTVQKAIESSGLYCDGVVKLVSSEELAVRSEELGVRGEELKGEEAKMDVKALWRGDIQNPETVEHADAYMESKVRPETKKNIAGAVLSAFNEEQAKGNQRALEQMSKPINGGFVPAYSNL